MSPPKFRAQENQQSEQFQAAQQHTGREHDFDEIRLGGIVAGGAHNTESGTNVSQCCGDGAHRVPGLHACGADQ